MNTAYALAAALGLAVLAPTPTTPQFGTNPTAKLVAKTKGAFFHVTWGLSGVQVLRTDRETGEMQVLASSGTRTIPTRRISFVNSRILGVLEHDEHLYVLSWSARSFDRPLRSVDDGEFIKPKPVSTFPLHVFPIHGGRARTSHCLPGKVWRDPEGKRKIREVTPDGIAGFLEVEDGTVHVFGKKRDPKK